MPVLSSPDWLSLYHRLPYTLRTVVAGARGYYLDRWRYSEQTEEWVATYLAHERWSAEQWANWQAERLAYLLERAATRVPYYRDQWALRRRQGDRAAVDLLENWPFLTKDALRQAPEAFVADNCRRDEMYVEHTSGTTGKPLHIWLSRETVQRWFALYEARARRWYGVRRGDRWAILGGQLVAPVSQKQPPFWVWNRGLNQLYLSAYHLAADNVPAYLQAMGEHGVTYLLGYPSGIFRLAQIVVERGLQPPKLTVAIGNAEPLYAHQRTIIEQAFDCPVRETYGMAEIAAAASECETGRLHGWPESGLIEIMADQGQEPVSPGEAGRLIATGLLNVDMPLIRYETGDRAALAAASETCVCGRTLPLLAGIEGRVDDVVLTRDGRHIGRLDPVFKADLPVVEAQIIQEDWDQLRVLLVPTDAYTEADGKALERRIHERVGADMHVMIETVAEIPRTSNGKFRAVISHVSGRHKPAEPRESVEADGSVQLSDRPGQEQRA